MHRKKNKFKVGKIHVLIKNDSDGPCSSGLLVKRLGPFFTNFEGALINFCTAIQCNFNPKS